MALKYWKGGDGSTDNEKGDFNRNGNWQTATGGATTVPTASDVMIFDARADTVPSDYTGTKHTKSNHWNCFYNMDQSDLDCQGIIRSADFTGLIGKDAEGTESPLKISLAASKHLIFRGNQTAVIQCAGTGKAIPLVIHDSASGTLKLSSLDETAEFSKVECFNSGNLELADDTKCVEIHSYGTTAISIGESCPAIKIYGEGGTIESNSAYDEVENYGASIIIGTTTRDATKPAIDIAKLTNISGNFTWRAAGKMTDFEIRSGNLYMKGDGDKQIGNSGNTFKLLGGTFDMTEQTGDITLGATCVMLIKGATVKFPEDFQIDDLSINHG